MCERCRKAHAEAHQYIVFKGEHEQHRIFCDSCADLMRQIFKVMRVKAPEAEPAEPEEQTDEATEAPEAEPPQRSARRRLES